MLCGFTERRLRNKLYRFGLILSIPYTDSEDEHLDRMIDDTPTRQDNESEERFLLKPLKAIKEREK